LTKNETVTVQIKYKDTKQKFCGDANQVWISINKFFGEMLPAIQTVQNILLTVELENLIDDCKNIIAISPEGPVVLIDNKKLTDNETLILHLLATYISIMLGKSNDYLTKEDLKIRLGKNSKITSTRLGELVRERLAKKNEKGNYEITTLGIKRFQQEILPEIREKAKL
jgi:hypothetical protein